MTEAFHLQLIKTHVFPAVEVAQVADFSLDNTVQGIAGALAENKLLNVCGLNLAAVVNDVAVGVNDDLGNVKAVALNLRVAQGGIDLSLARGSSNAVHLIGVWTKTVLEIVPEKRQGVLVVYTPSPVGVSMVGNQLAASSYAP